MDRGIGAVGVRSRRVIIVVREGIMSIYFKVEIVEMEEGGWGEDGRGVFFIFGIDDISNSRED